jgi:hypothetical protein
MCLSPTERKEEEDPGGGRESGMTGRVEGEGEGEGETRGRERYEREHGGKRGKGQSRSIGDAMMVPFLVLQLLSLLLQLLSLLSSSVLLSHHTPSLKDPHAAT